MGKAIISVKGTQKNEREESDTIEIVTEGSFYVKGNTFYITYDETEISGMDGTTTTLKVTENKVTLMRFGSNKSRMIFQKNKRHESDYMTPYGKVLLGIEPSDLHVNLSKVGGEITIKYIIDLDKKVVSNNELYLKVREVN
ncbi:MAG: DUF1934 domain-containing protein [Thermoanaerobacteraceae bacterium]